MCTNLHAAWIVPQGVVCRQGISWENQSSSDNKEVSECVQTYKLHRLCHRMLFAGKERNQSSSDNKRSVSVYKLTGCIDCATECCLQARKEINQVQTTRGQ